MNTELLERLKKRILKAPKRLNIKYWGDSTRLSSLDAVLEEPACHTQACLAGELLLMLKKVRVVPKTGGLRTKDGVYPAFADEACKELGLEYEQGMRLFKFKSWGFNHGWPSDFENLYNAAKTQHERAQVTAKRIDHFIATNGAE